MIAAQRAGVRRWWLSAALVGLVVALGAGILGMHALTASHLASGGHGATAGGAVDPPSGADTFLAVPIEDRAGASLDAGASPSVHGIASPVVSLAEGGDAGTDCDASCEAAVGSLCVAVLGALLVLAFARRDRGVLGPPARRFTTRAVVAALPSRSRPAPSLAVLCISRT